MATLYITEYSQVAPIMRDVRAQAGFENGQVTRQTVTYTTSTASAAFQDSTRLIRVMADAYATLEFGTAPTADANDHPIQANVEYWFGVPEATDFKVAAYDGSS